MTKEEQMFRHKDYRHLAEIRTLRDELKPDKMILEGKAVTFNDATILFEYDGEQYKEIIEKGAFEKCDLSKAFLKYNHSNNIMAMARTKNKSLQIDVKEDGVYIIADLANTTAGRDLYELVKRGDIDKMSFAFTIGEESYDKDTRTWTIHKVDTLYDVACVEMPAYENTSIFARRYEEVEANRRAEVEALELEKQRMIAQIRLKISPKRKQS